VSARTWARRAAAAVGLAAILGLAGGGAALADGPQDGLQARDAQAAKQGENAGQDNGGGIFSSLLDSLCPRIQPPTPQSPYVYADPLPNKATIGTPSEVPGTKGGLYGEYETGGLFWTTYDQSCLDLSRVDTSTGSGINGALVQIDQMVNELQQLALSPDAGMPYDSFLTTALGEVKDALWTPWMATGVIAAGVIGGFVLVRNAPSDGIEMAFVAVAVLGLVSWMTLYPTSLPHLSDQATAGVTQSMARVMVKVTGGDPNEVPAQAQAETYYRATSYESWITGEFCGDTAAAAKYGPRFLDDQAFSHEQWDQVKGDPAKAQAMMVAKQERWKQDAAGLKNDFPATFACWAGETNTRTSAAGKHAVVTVLAGGVTAITSGAVGVMRVVARMVPLLFVGFGVLMLVSRRVFGGFVQLAVIAVAGPPVIAGFGGIVLFGMSATLSDANEAWWRSIVAAVLLAVGAWVCWRHISGVLHGASAVELAGKTARDGGRRARQELFGGRGNSRTRGAVAGAAAGAVAGEAAGAAASEIAERAGGSGSGDDAREEAGPSRPPAEPTRGPEWDGSPQHVNADHPDQTPVWVSNSEDGVRVDIGAEPGAVSTSGGSTFQAAEGGADEQAQEGTVMTEQGDRGSDEDRMMARQKERLAQFRRQAQENGTPATGVPGWLGTNADVGGDEPRA
jgi:hypothetical protein